MNTFNSLQNYDYSAAIPFETRLTHNLIFMLPGLIVIAILLYFGFKKLRQYNSFSRHHIVRSMRITAVEMLRLTFDVHGSDGEVGLPKDQRFKSSKKVCPTELTCKDETGKQFIFAWYGIAPDWAKKGNTIEVQHMPGDASRYRLPGQKIKRGYIRFFIWAVLASFFTVYAFLTSTFLSMFY